MKKLALDIGDSWTGVALSDPLGILARPYETIESEQLIPFLQTTFASQKIDTAVVGYPKTMRGTESAQTKKIVEIAEQLKEKFPEINWVLWDERLTSKQASALQKDSSKEAKRKSHAIAAAFILSCYLEHQILYKQQ